MTTETQIQMTGSEKQIAWATDIRTKRYQELASEQAKAQTLLQSRQERNAAQSAIDQAAGKVEGLTLVKDAFDRQNRADFWINTQHRSFDDFALHIRMGDASRWFLGWQS